MVRDAVETETRNGRQGRLANHLTRMDFIILDELGYLPFAQSGGQLLFHLVSRSDEAIRWVKVGSRLTPLGGVTAERIELRALVWRR